MPVYNILSDVNYYFIQGYNQTLFFICYISANHSKNLVTLLDAAFIDTPVFLFPGFT